MSIPETVELGNGVAVVHQGTCLREAADFPVVVTLAVPVAGSTAIGVATNAIYDFLKTRVKKPAVSITVDRTQVDFEEGEIKRIVSERINNDRDTGGSRQPIVTRRAETRPVFGRNVAEIERGP